MNSYSIFAIYVIFWWACLFLVLPFRLRSSDDPEDHVPGQAESAPPHFSVGRTVFWTTVLTTIVFGLFYVNYVNGWVTAEFFNLTRFRGGSNSRV